MWGMNIAIMAAQAIYDFLDIGKSPRPADCIFVFSGKQDCKIHGIRMWRFGYATQVILSVRGSEREKIGDLGLDSDGGLSSFAEQAPAGKHHFLVRLDRQEAFCTPVQIGFFGTRSEAFVLAENIRNLPFRSLLVVSSPLHLRRVSLALRRALRKTRTQFTLVAIPERPVLSNKTSRREVWLELLKYIFSRMLL